MAMIRQHIYYSGHVQGVGFRYKALRCARGYNVTGYVKNLPDGRVELVAEGEKKEIDKVLQDIQRAMEGHIWDTSSDEGEFQGGFSGFSIGV